MKTISLTQGKVALVDSADFKMLSRFKWHARFTGKKFYATRFVEGRKSQQMHQLLIDKPKGMDIDHRNGDGLDNRRENLRICSRSQNSMNRKRRRDSGSRFKGVFFRWGTWNSTIYYRGHRYSLGQFDSDEDAATTYNVAAQLCFGEFAYLNDV